MGNLTSAEMLAMAKACQRQAEHFHARIAPLVKRGWIHAAIHHQGLVAEWSAAARRYQGIKEEPCQPKQSESK